MLDLYIPLGGCVKSNPKHHLMLHIVSYCMILYVQQEKKHCFGNLHWGKPTISSREKTTMYNNHSEPWYKCSYVMFKKNWVGMS